jgi:hypothetical protein
MKRVVSFVLALTLVGVSLVVSTHVTALSTSNAQANSSSAKIPGTGPYEPPEPLNPATDLKERIFALENQILQAKDAGNNVTLLERQLQELYAQQTRPHFAGALDLQGGNSCADATDLSGTALPLETLGTTVGHLQNYSCVGLGTNPPACWSGGYNEALACHGPSATYKFTIPTTGSYIISTCNLGTDFDTGLLIYRWTCPTEPVNPGDYICGNDDAAGCGLQSTVTTTALTEGTAILIVVSGYGDASGNYGLTIDQAGVTRSYNDLCVNAQLVVPSDTTVWDYTTTHSTADHAPTCNTFDDTAPGNWYVVVGTGDSLTATTCSAITNFDTRLSIYCGQCDNLTCITANDDYTCATGSNLTSRASWCSELGRQYFILVHGYLQATGEYALKVTDNGVTCTGALPCAFTAPLNDSCVHAASVNVPSVTGGTTLGATVDSNALACEDVNVTAPGVWYSVIGAGHRFVATTCNDSTTYDTKLSVYCGSCTDLRCVGADDDDFTCAVNSLNSRVEWCAAEGQEYLILVHGFSSHTGHFVLSVYDTDSTCNDPVACAVQHPANDYCANPEPLAVGASVVATTTTASIDTVPLCSDYSATGPGVWYLVPGNGHVLRATTCADTASTNFDTKLFVFCGRCDSMNCIGADDDDELCPSSTLQSTVRFCSEPGRDYRVLVTGYLGATGRFRLSILDTDSACTDFITCGPEAAPEPTGTAVKDYALRQNYPNPFNPTTTIAFDLPKAGLVRLEVYNILGQQVAMLVNGVMPSGTHQVNFNGANLTSGLYFYKIQAGEYTSIKKMMLLK